MSEWTIHLQIFKLTLRMFFSKYQAVVSQPQKEDVSVSTYGLTLKAATSICVRKKHYETVFANEVGRFCYQSI